jgi:hypothetical protein
MFANYITALDKPEQNVYIRDVRRFSGLHSIIKFVFGVFLDLGGCGRTEWGGSVDILVGATGFEPATLRPPV